MRASLLPNSKLRKESKHLSEYWTDQGIKFIEQSQRDNPDKPFFLFLAYNGPYSLSEAMKEPVPSPWSDPYVDNPRPSFPRPGKVHPWQRNQHELIGDVQIGRNLAGQVTAVDAGVGRIFETLKKLNDWEDVVFYDFENVRHIRTGEWKYVERLGQAPEFELFNLKDDPLELTNLVEKTEHSKLKAELSDRLHSWY